MSGCSEIVRPYTSVNQTQIKPQSPLNPFLANFCNTFRLRACDHVASFSSSLHIRILFAKLSFSEDVQEIVELYRWIISEEKGGKPGLTVRGEGVILGWWSTETELNTTAAEIV